MKKRISLVLSLCLVASMIHIPVSAADTTGDYIAQLSEMVAEYDNGNYFGTISVKIGDSNLSIDGEAVPIDESGSAAYVENGRTMLPVRGIAEAMGADVSYNEKSETVSIQSAEVSVQMIVGENSMTVNGETQSLITAPEIKNDRTMLPVRDVAEALDCEVEWDEEAETAVFTKQYQTKRLIVFGNNINDENAAQKIVTDEYTVFQYKTVADAKAAADKFRSEGYIAEPDGIVTTEALSWGVDTIGSVNYANQTKSSGRKCVVAVVDSGIAYDHPFFSGRLVDGYDIYNNDNYCEDIVQHGTHVSSTVLDVADGNRNVKVMPVKVFGSEGSTSDSMVAAGIDYAVQNGADVINLSLSGPYESEIEKRAVQKAQRKNIAVIASAGNDYKDISKSYVTPACIDGVICVSAVNKNGSLASFSNYGFIDFAAPGVNIKGAKASGGYVSWDGTSMAAPHVSGVYALVKSAHPNLEVHEITTGLKKCATSKGNERYFGAGIICMNGLEKALGYENEKPIENEPIKEEPIKEEPVASELKINPSAYPSGALTQGKSFNLSGRIKSNYHITDVRSYLLDSNYNAVQEASGWTTTKTYVIEGSALDTGLKFENLSAGTYYLKYTASDESGNNVSWTSGAFTVVKEETKAPGEPSTSAVVLIPSSFENLSIRTGPSTDYQIIGSMNHTDKCLVYTSKTQNGWYYVEYGGVKGYAAGNYIYLPPETRTGIVNIPSSWDNLSIRTGPSTNYTIVGSMNHGERCTVFTDKARNGWYYVEHNGVYGYAAGNRIDLQ